MKIDRIEIKSFGKLKDFRLDLKAGFQVIYGQNEQGKSTIMAFIKMMFYSKLGQGKEIDKNMRVKYQPWDQSHMEGAIEFHHLGVAYRLQKRIGATAGKDKIELINKLTGETVALGKKEEAGTYLFGLTLNEFERSGYIGQIGGFSADLDADELSARILSNVITSGEETVSQPKVADRLNLAVEDMKSKSGKKGILIETARKLEELKIEKLNLEKLYSSQSATQEEFYRVEALIQQKKALEWQRDIDNAADELKSLDAFISEIKEYEDKKRQLFIDKFSYEELVRFLEERQREIKSIEEEMIYLSALKDPVSGGDGNSITVITEEEYQAVKEKIREKEKLEDLWKSLNQDFRPAYENYRNLYENLTALTEEEVRIAEETLQLKPFYVTYEETAYRLETIENNKEQSTKNYQNQQEIRTAKIDSAKEKERAVREEVEFFSSQNRTAKETQRTSTAKILYLILGGILGALSIVLAVFADPRYLFLLLAAGAFIVVGRISQKAEKVPSDSSRKKEQALSRLRQEQQEMQTLVQSQEEAETSYRQEMINLEQQITDCRQTLKELERNYHEYLDLQRKQTELFSQVNETRIHCEARKDTLDKYISDIKSRHEEVLKEAIFFEDRSVQDSEELNEFMTELDRRLALLANDISACIALKDCDNESEYERNYNIYASNQKNRKSIDNTKEKIDQLKNQFLNKIDRYQKAESYELAKAFINELQQSLKELDDKQLIIQRTAEGRGMTEYSLERVIADRENLENKLVKLQENSVIPVTDSLAKEEIIRQIEDLKEQDLENKRMEIVKRIKTPERDFASIEREMRLCQQELEEKTLYFDGLCLAKEVMEEAADEMRLHFAPELNQITGNIFQELTNGRYEKVLVSKDFNINVQSDIYLREWKYLSSGTIDQAYLALRLAISELIAKNNSRVPLLLDDSLMQYDDERLRKTLSFLEDYAERTEELCQILLFTCHRHVTALVSEDKVIELG